MKDYEIENALVTETARILEYKASEVYIEKMEDHYGVNLVVVYEGLTYREYVNKMELVRATKPQILDYLQTTIEKLVYKINGSPK